MIEATPVSSAERRATGRASAPPEAAAAEEAVEGAAVAAVRNRTTYIYEASMWLVIMPNFLDRERYRHRHTDNPIMSMND